jgi:hypothetical protein
MVWLLCGLVLLGVALLLAAVVPLLRRLRANRTEAVALRAGMDERLARLRVTRAHITEWRRSRGGTGQLGPDA